MSTNKGKEARQREMAEKIGKLSLFIINKTHNVDGKNDIWESAVQINSEAKKIYKSTPVVWSTDDDEWDRYLDWCRRKLCSRIIIDKLMDTHRLINEVIPWFHYRLVDMIKGKEHRRKPKGREPLTNKINEGPNAKNKFIKWWIMDNRR